MPQRPVEEIAERVLIPTWGHLPAGTYKPLMAAVAAALSAERARVEELEEEIEKRLRKEVLGDLERSRCEELEKALSLVMAQVACGNLVRSRPWAIKQVPLVTALAKATALLLRDSGTPASEETGE